MWYCCAESGWPVLYSSYVSKTDQSDKYGVNQTTAAGPHCTTVCCIYKKPNGEVISYSTTLKYDHVVKRHTLFAAQKHYLSITPI